MSEKFNLEGAARRLDISVRRLRILIQAKQIGHSRTGKSSWIFSEEDLDEFLARHRIAPLEMKEENSYGNQ